MSEAIIHLLVPLVIILIVSFFYKLDKKMILILSIFSLLPDIDFFMGWHRATFHNLFFGVILVIIAVLVLKKYYSKAKIALVGSYFFLSHLVLDGFLVAWFYPFQQFHYNPFTGTKVTLEQMNAIRPHYPIKYFFIEILFILLIYLILGYFFYFKNNNNKTK